MNYGKWSSLAPAAQVTRRAQARRRTARIHRHPVHPAIGLAVGNAAAGNGLRLGHDVLAPGARLANGGRLKQIASSFASQIAPCRPARFFARDCRLLVGTCRAWGKKTGPHPTDRRKAGSKHHLVVDGNGTPLNVILSGANRHDSTQLLPLLDGVPPIAGRPGRPLAKPACVQADRAYDGEAYRRSLRQRRICPQIGKRCTEHGSHLGMTRWVVECTFAWLHQLAGCACAMNAGRICIKGFFGRAVRSFAGERSAGHSTIHSRFHFVRRS